jgi:hypothetical protein
MCTDGGVLTVYVSKPLARDISMTKPMQPTLLVHELRVTTWLVVQIKEINVI